MEYITIAEYAKRARISKQTAYNRAKAPQYKQFFRKINGVLMADSSLLEVKENFKIDSSLESVENKGNSDIQFKENSREFSSVEFELFESQKKQIEEQNKRIDELFSMIAEKDKTILELSRNISQITASIQQLQHERNLLEAGQQVIDGQTKEPAPSPAPDVIDESSSKRGLFSRFWKRNK